MIVSYSYQCFMHIYSDISFYHFLDTNIFGYLFLIETFYHLIQIYLVILFISKSYSGRVSQIFEYSTICILFNINIHLYHIYVVFFLFLQIHLDIHPTTRIPNSSVRLSACPPVRHANVSRFFRPLNPQDPPHP